MKKRLLTIATIFSAFAFPLAAQVTTTNTCVSTGTPGGGGTGDVVIFANYDGGILNINVDQNIPNLKIGVCTYEPVTINITGTFAANVTEVRYAGYVSTNNNHCPNSPTTTTINGAGGAATSVNFLPPATLSNPGGYGLIVCGYTCDTIGNQGGCNTADQIQHYFTTTMNGTLRSYYTQYGCWSNTPYNVSAGGNCSATTVINTTTTFTTSDISICVGDKINFTDSSPGATGWSWTAPSSNSPSATSPNLNGVSWSTAGTYTVTLATTHGTEACSTSQVITVNPLPQIQASATDSTLCLNDSTVLSATTTGMSVSWQPGSFMGASYPVGPTSDTWYYAFTTDANGCQNKDSVEILVFPLAAVPTINFNAGVFTAMPVAASYQWYFNGNLIAGATGQMFTPMQNGTYNVGITDGNGCEGISSSFVIATFGIMDENNWATVSIFPNPTTGIFSVDIKSAGASDVLLDVIDMLGRPVMTRALNVNAGDNKFMIDLGMLSKGMYEIRMITGGHRLSEKIILQ